MSLLHATIRPLLRFALELHYVEIQTVGLDALPASGPLILAANHPNSLLDTVLLSTRTDRRIHFLARSGLFRHRLARILFTRLGAIPIHRREDHPAAVGSGDPPPSNEAVFASVFDVLSHGGCIGIFPEGRNSPDGHVAPFRSGVARMALGAEAAHDFQLGVRILPVGIYFEQRERFFTGVLLRFGEPIDIRPWKEAWQKDPVAAARAITAELQRAIRQETLHVSDERRTGLVRSISAIIGEELIDDLLIRCSPQSPGLRARILNELKNTPYPRRDLDDAFQAQQYIADVVEELSRDHPEALDELHDRVRRYEDHTRQLRLRHEVLTRTDPLRVSSVRDTIRLTLYAVAFLPAALWGLVHHFVPTFLLRRLADRAPDEAIRAITAFSGAIVLYPMTYALLGWWLWRYASLSP
jgi:glycerol-3-phosphate O-acyltransferase/dihydroxyacetone phosphate acyltransferase